MLPSVFLSLSGTDEKFVARVHERLPEGLAYFYPRSFANGEDLLSAMESRVGKASIFVLFASRASVDSVWVKFEIDQARLARIRRPDFRVLVFPIEPEIVHSALPSWMQGLWVPRAGRNPRDIARYIRNILAVTAMSPQRGSAYGRGPFVDAAKREVQDTFLNSKELPNIFVFAGNVGIGRRTVARELMEDAFPATPELNYGPEFQLPQFADLDDIYRALRQEIEPQFSLKKFQADLAAFNAMSVEARAIEVATNISHFGKLGQAVTVVTGNGIYEERGILKPWVPVLFRTLASDRSTKFIVISNRLIHENERHPHPNVLQFNVPALNDRDIRALMIATAPLFGKEPELPNEEVLRAIGGHPGIAKVATYLIAQKGALVLNDDMRSLYTIQEEVLSESLDVGTLSDLQKDILSILSWVPQLNGSMLKDVIIQHRSVSTETFAETLSELIVACLVNVSGENYLISPPLRVLFRRKHGYGSIELRNQFSRALKEAWRIAQDKDELRTELFDAFVFMAALEGGTLPAEFSGLLLPSTLQEIVRDKYDRGHEDDEALRRVAVWGLPAKVMKMDETAREEILSYVVRAQTRLEDLTGAEETLKFIDQKQYRSRFYLRSFYVRHTGGDLQQAITLLRRAREAGKYLSRVNSDLAICYHRLGMWKELEELLVAEQKYVDRNPVLLDVKIGGLIAKRDFNQAEIAIRNLRILPYEDGRADSRSAIILMQRDRNYAGAQQLLTLLLSRKTGGHVAVRRLRAIAAASAGDFDTARADAAVLKPTRGGRDMAIRIEARIKMGHKSYDEALAELEKLSLRTAQDELLHARILENKASDLLTPISERDALRTEAAQIRSKFRMVDELELNF
jgi:tetratricopeptide (TPR) repeat protein